MTAIGDCCFGRRLLFGLLLLLLIGLPGRSLHFLGDVADRCQGQSGGGECFHTVIAYLLQSPEYRIPKRSQRNYDKKKPETITIYGDHNLNLLNAI